MNILVNGGGFSNKGAEAMLLTVQRELAQRISEANFHMRARPEQAERAYTSGFIPSVGTGARFAKAVKLARACAKSRHVCRAALVSPISALEVSEFKQVDAVLDISGFLYSDVWGASLVNRGLAWARYCQAKGKHFICLPQAWGPFAQGGVANSVRRLCECASIVYARDGTSLAHLKTLMGMEYRKLKESPDIAFLFQGANADVGKSVLGSLGFAVGSRPLIGLSPNLRIYERCQGVGAQNQYVRCLRLIVRHCITKLQATVVLLPHEVAAGKVRPKDDRFLCGLIRMSLDEPEHCIAISEDLRASTLKSIAGHLDLLIGSRFHSLVFALSSGVPAIALGWSHKYPELMQLVGLDHNSLMGTDSDENAVMEMLDEAWTRRRQTGARIAERLPEIRRQVHNVFDDVAEILGGRCS